MQFKKLDFYSVLKPVRKEELLSPKGGHSIERSAIDVLRVKTAGFTPPRETRVV
jgi:hypothetical protein